MEKEPIEWPAFLLLRDQLIECDVEFGVMAGGKLRGPVIGIAMNDQALAIEIEWQALMFKEKEEWFRVKVSKRGPFQLVIENHKFSISRAKRGDIHIESLARNARVCVEEYHFIPRRIEKLNYDSLRQDDEFEGS